MTDQSPNAEQTREAIRIATQQMPGDPELRREPIDRVVSRIEREKAAVREAKDEVDVAGAWKAATDVYGWQKSVVKTVLTLDKMDHGDRAGWIAQLAIALRDRGYLDKDLVDMATEAAALAGTAVDEQGSVFDKTDAASRQGVATAEPKHVAEQAEVSAAAPTPGIPLDEALAKFEEAKAKHGDKPGRKPKYLMEAEKAYQEAKDASERVAEADEPVTGQMAGTAAAGDEHIRAQTQRKPINLDDDEEPAVSPSNPLSDVTGSASYTMS